ncbi:MAG: universal stress protein [Rhodobacteraceae bacterium]|nr:universal stress protein [Paracoccaceae bacterium]MCY4196642.1 universal stress protein [Paracoccaceae bacterium]MCY4328307.1 universal stress protein [Paracoccaceae bacterium]
MRKFLVILDDSNECANAMRFAALRASKTNGGVIILSIIPPEEFKYWGGVGDIMRDEAHERIRIHFNTFAMGMKKGYNVSPELVVREGPAVQEILGQISDDPEIGVLVLAAGDTRDGPGPLISSISRSFGTLPIPVTIVPGQLSRERLEAIT